MTIEEEIRRRLLAHGIPEERLNECMDWIKADALMRGMKKAWGTKVQKWSTVGFDSLTTCAKGSANTWYAIHM